MSSKLSYSSLSLAHSHSAQQAVKAVTRPRGSSGRSGKNPKKKGFSLIKEMGLDGNDEGRAMFKNISVRLFLLVISPKFLLGTRNRIPAHDL